LRHWQTKPLGDLCKERDERCGSQSLPILSITKNRGIVLQADRFKKRIASKDVARYKVIHSGDFGFDPMLLWSGSISRHLGPTSGVVSPAYSVFAITSNDLNPSFLYRFLGHPDRLDFYDRISFGTNERRRKAQFSDFAKLQIPLPPIPEQVRIVKLLDEADELRTLRAQAENRTTDLIPSLFQKVFGNVGSVPSLWPTAPLGMLTTIESKLVDPREHTYRDLPHIGADRIESDSGKLLPSKSAVEDGLISAKFLFDEQDVLYCKIRPYLRKVALPSSRGLCSADVYPIRPGPRLVREFLWSYLLTDHFTARAGDLSARANMPKLNRVQFASIDCPVPPLSLQKSFANQVTEIRGLQTNQSTSREQIDSLFQSALQQAFRGEL